MGLTFLRVHTGAGDKDFLSEDDKDEPYSGERSIPVNALSLTRVGRSLLSLRFVVLPNVYFALRGDDWTDEQKAEIESLPFRYLVLLQKM